MKSPSRRDFVRSFAAAGALAAGRPLAGLVGAAPDSGKSSRPMQLFQSLSDEQRAKICLPVNDARRQYVDNWWYVHKEHRIHNTFNADQQDLIRQIFDSLHHADYRAAINKQVEQDKFGKIGNTPAVGFFGTPADKDFEFIYTGHHVTRRCNAHTDRGLGFGDAPIFYGHFDKKFHETKDHVGNPYWYQGKIFNRFVQALDGRQQAKALVGNRPRSERSHLVIKKKTAGWEGLSGSELSKDQQEKLFETMRAMMEMFRPDDVAATMKAIRKPGRIDRLFVSYYDGKFDVGGDRVWDTWQIEGPDMVWYFRGYPHIHTYFHVRA